MFVKGFIVGFIVGAIAMIIWAIFMVGGNDE